MDIGPCDPTDSQHTHVAVRACRSGCERGRETQSHTPSHLPLVFEAAEANGRRPAQGGGWTSRCLPNAADTTHSKTVAQAVRWDRGEVIELHVGRGSFTS